MVKLIGPLSFHEEINLKHVIDSKSHYTNNKYPRRSQRSNHILKRKCKNFYKYRLRRNGEEDPDVIDVSHILLSTLKIKSPTKFSRSPENTSNVEELRPKNYLFKMARRKQKVKALEPEAVIKNEKDGNLTISSTENKPKQQTNAFQLLMDSRNKSIGTNSPGKEISSYQSEIQEAIEKKDLKVKRKLALQKMAEAKGSIQRKQLEDYKDKCIEQLMEKRAERLKNMIKPKVSKTLKKAKETFKDVEHVVEIDVESNDNKDYVEEIHNKKIKSLHLVDMFKKSNNISPDKKVIPKEDEEFLNKLSPSIKKKENMLCYFRKIDKTSPPSNTEVTVDESSVLKIKISSKRKNRLKKKRLSLSEKPTSIVLKDLNENSCSTNDTEFTERQTYISTNPKKELEKNCNQRKKRKHEENAKSNETQESKKCIVINPIEEPNIDESQRPKRHIKKPVKYLDDIQFSSSDDELHIFTPRKKKRGDCDSSHKMKKSTKGIVISDDESKKKVFIKPKKNLKKEEDIQKKPSKLAPIFTPKPQLKLEQLEAKQKFLYSGVPDEIKKMAAQQKSLNTEILNNFPVVVHVQQKETLDVTSIPFGLLAMDYSSDDDVINSNNEQTFSSLIIKKQDNPPTILPSLKKNVTAVLQNIKECYPKFPVHRIFRLLKTKSKGEFKDSLPSNLDDSSEGMHSIIDIANDNPEYLNWADKYKATSTKNLIGNFESIKELKRWLLSWTEIEQRSKSLKAKESDTSDFYDSDSNSRDSIKNNLLIVTGPVGCGKTSSVYAVAAELAIKVIEVNASSKRTGKVMLQDLQEATQSHKVNRAGSDNSQKSQEIVETVITVVSKKRGRPKKAANSLTTNNKTEKPSESQPTASQDQVRTGMSLILVDDADIVFDQDDGFSSAIAQLIQSSKRPVILVTGTVTCPHLQRFLQYGKVINMQPLLPKMLGTWLDIMCLAEGTCSQGLGAKVLDYFKGDIRKSINFLQFFMTAQSQDTLKGEEASQNSGFKQIPDEENSNMSWPDSEGMEDKIVIETTTNSKDIVWKQFMNNQANFLYMEYPKDLLSVWWNVQSLLNCQPIPVQSKQSKKRSILELETLADVIDNFSVSDYFSSNEHDRASNITSKPWLSSETDSVSEQDCLDNYNRCHEVTSSIIQGLVSTSINVAQKSLQCERNTCIQFPSMAAQREKDRLTSRHDNLTTILNPSAILDRKALALDYWSSCRTICRIEKNKTDTVSKRNNRFCHYLKSMNVVCRKDSFHSLADSLFFRGKLE